jgi:hypothetical protein
MSGKSGTPDGASGMSDALRLIEKLTQQNLELAGRVGYLQAELQQAREQLALAAPKMASEAGPDPEAISRPATRAWWRFWRG